jgi:hypothetical protein
MLVLVPPAWAYIDPATTTYLIQILTALVVTLGVSLSVFLYRFHVIAANARALLHRVRLRLRSRQTKLRMPKELVYETYAGEDDDTGEDEFVVSGEGPQARSLGRHAVPAGASRGPRRDESRDPRSGPSRASDPRRDPRRDPPRARAQRTTLNMRKALAEGLIDYPLPVRSNYPRLAPMTRSDASTAPTRRRGAVRPAGAGHTQAREARTWRGRLAVSSLLSAGLSFTFVVFGMLDPVLSNGGNFPFDFEDILGPVLNLGLVVFVVLAVGLSLFRGVVFDVLVCLGLSLLLGIYLQSTFLNGSIGLLLGEARNFSALDGQMVVLNVLLWAGVAAAVFAARFTPARPVWKGAVYAVPSLLVVVQLVALLSLTSTSGSLSSQAGQSGGQASTVGADGRSTAQTLTMEGAFEVSSGNNVIVFVLDMLDEEFIDEISRTEPAFFNQLDGFTQFTNNTSVYNTTYPSVINLLTNTPLDVGLSVEDYTNKAYRNGSFITDLRAEGFSSELFMDYYYTYSDIRQLDGLADNIGQISFEINTDEVLTQLARLSLLRCAPYALKPGFWMSNDDFRYARTINSSSFPYISDDVAFYEKLHANRLSIRGSKGNFSYFHLNGSHYPFKMNANIQRVSETTGAEQTMGAFNIVYEYLAEMKRLGVYDDATIIITGDHPTHKMYEELQKPMLVGLFVKPAGSAGTALKTSAAPVSLDNLRATCVAAAGGDSTRWGKTYFEVRPSDSVTRYYYQRLSTENETRKYLCKYMIVGDARDWKNWVLVEKIPYDANWLW